MARKKTACLTKHALRLAQNSKHPLFLFSLTGAELLAVADISKVGRNDAGALLGYQRDEVKRHVRDIAGYLDGEDVLFPNSIILALSSAVAFRSSVDVDDAAVMAGTLEIPVPRDGEVKPAWIVDGQQRALALSRSRRSDWPVPVNGFVADDIEVQRDQFLRVNNSRPLPRGLIIELLPGTTAVPPRGLGARRLPSTLCDLLARDPASPFFGLIRRPSTPAARRKAAVVADTGVVKMLEESLTTPSGCLFPFHNLSSGETDFDSLWRVLVAYWSAVRAIFPEAWGRPPVASRLMHGTGIRAMGRLMDRVMSAFDPKDPQLATRAEQELQVVAPACHWTAGRWDDLGLDWNEIQNVPRHLKLVSNFLVRAYLHGRGGGV